VSFTLSDDMDIKVHLTSMLESSMVISEVFYRPSSDQGGDDSEFIEIINTSDQDINLSGYSLKNAVTFTFPQGSTIEANGIFVVCADLALYEANGFKAYQWDSGGLSNLGARIVLENAQGQVSDQVSYILSAPWPEASMGNSIELVDVFSDNSLGNTWVESNLMGGTPGQPNSIGPFHDLRINEFVALPGKMGYFGSEDWIEIYNKGSKALDLGGAVSK